jgi:hypothetical protein
MHSCPFCACTRPRNHPRSMSISAYNLRSIISVQCVDSYNDITTVTIMASGGQLRRHPGGNRAAGLGRPVRGIRWLPHEYSPGYDMSVSVGILYVGESTYFKDPIATSTSHFVLFKAIGQCAKTPKSNKKFIETFDCRTRSTTLTVALKEGIVASTALVLDVEVFKSSTLSSWGMTSIATGYLVLMTLSCVRSWTIDVQ